jgi:hypothetical protein
MNALQYSPSPKKPKSQGVVPLRPRQSQPSQQSQPSRWGITAEVGLKVAVNGLLSTAAVAALINLLPYYTSQQAKLREVQSEVQQTETQVDQLQAEFSYSFDPLQARRVMQAQSGRVDPNQRQIVLIQKKGEEVSGY